MIQGVTIKDLKVIPDERGRLMEIVRADDDFFHKFGQVYMTSCYPGVVKGWHYHRKQTDYMTAIYGMLKIVLYDMREDSPTRGEINEFFSGERNHILITIPPGVCHGFKCIGTTEALVINTVTEPYKYDDPDEFRIDPHDNDIGYDWSRRDG